MAIKIPLDPRVVRALKAQKAAFIKKFGREPGPSDPIFLAVIPRGDGRAISRRAPEIIRAAARGAPRT
jgi:hypothetical protein